jgi:hypothetical protein
MRIPGDLEYYRLFGSMWCTASAAVHRYNNANNLQLIIKKGTTHGKVERVVLKGHFYISNQELLTKSEKLKFAQPTMSESRYTTGCLSDIESRVVLPTIAPLTKPSTTAPKEPFNCLTKILRTIRCLYI